MLATAYAPFRLRRVSMYRKMGLSRWDLLRRDAHGIRHHVNGRSGRKIKRKGAKRGRRFP